MGLSIGAYGFLGRAADGVCQHWSGPARAMDCEMRRWPGWPSGSWPACQDKRNCLPALGVADADAEIFDLVVIAEQGAKIKFDAGAWVDVVGAGRPACFRAHYLASIVLAVHLEFGSGSFGAGVDQDAFQRIYPAPASAGFFAGFEAVDLESIWAACGHGVACDVGETCGKGYGQNDHLGVHARSPGLMGITAVASRAANAQKMMRYDPISTMQGSS